MNKQRFPLLLKIEMHKMGEMHRNHDSSRTAHPV